VAEQDACRRPTITDPPYALAREFIERALSLTKPTTGIVAMLHCICRLSGSYSALWGEGRNPHHAAVGTALNQPRRRPRKKPLFVVFCLMLAVSPSSAALA
jgi:hypothetical protein